MKVLVTGHEGFIGKNLVKYIQDHTDWEVRGWEWKEKEYPTIDGNDWVIHLGAISSTTEQDVDKILKQNFEFSQWIYNSCRINYVNLQYASSASVYGQLSNFKEDTELSPKTPYAWSKYLFDRWAQKEEVAYGHVVQGFRYFNVYGNLEEHKGNQASPVTQFRKQAKETGVIKIFENSENYLRDFISVEDICRMHLDFIKVKESGIWNMGTGSPVSFEYVAKLVADLYKAHIEYVEMPEILKSGYQSYTCANTEKLIKTIGPQDFITVDRWLKQLNTVL